MFLVYSSRRWHCINYVKGHADSLASWVLWVRTEEPHPGQTTARPYLSPRIMFLEGRAQAGSSGHPVLVLTMSGHAQQLSGGIWNILSSHLRLSFLKSTLHMGNMERREGVSHAAP